MELGHARVSSAFAVIHRCIIILLSRARSLHVAAVGYIPFYYLLFIVIIVTDELRQDIEDAVSRMKPW